jgi:hypothetical protein
VSHDGRDLRARRAHQPLYSDDNGGTMIAAMVYEKPIIDERELLRAINPLHARGRERLRRLQHSEVLTMGVAVDAAAGTRFYCSLNRDTLSAYRHGKRSVARELREEAARIEAQTIAPWVTALQEYSSADEKQQLDGVQASRLRDEWMERAVFGIEHGGDEAIAEPVWRAANEIAAVRARYEPHDVGAGLIAGRLWHVGEVFAEVRAFPPNADQQFAFLTEEILSAGLRLGDPIIVRHEELAPGVLLTQIERGLEQLHRHNRLSGDPLPVHLEDLLDASSLGQKTSEVPPLRRVA